MPRRDGSGPMGAGGRTGRGLGPCDGAMATRQGAGRGMGPGRGLLCRRGFGRGFGRGCAFHEVSAETDQELLQEEKELLQSRLNIVTKELERR